MTRVTRVCRKLSYALTATMLFLSSAATAAGYPQPGALPGVTTARPDEAWPRPSELRPARPEREQPDVVVTASRIEQEVSETPDAISVVTRADFEADGARNVAEAVRRAPGVLIQPYGGLGSLSAVSMRGSRANQVLLLRDGRPVNDVSSGEADASQILTGSVGRVEVLRGPSSLLYGSSAVGGVINVISLPAPATWQGSLEGRGGTYDTRLRRARAGGPVGPARFAVSHSGIETGGARPNAAYESEEFVLRADALARPRLEVNAGAYDAALGVPGPRPAADPADRSALQAQFGDGEVTSLIDRQRDRRRYADARLIADVRDGNEVSARHYTEFNELGFTFGSYFGFGNPEVRTSELSTDVQGAEVRYTSKTWLGGGHRLTVGGTWRKERLVTSERVLDTVTGAATRTPLIRARVEQGAEFAEAAFKPLEAVGRLPGIDDVTLAAGGRHDRHSSFGSVLNPHAGVVVDAAGVTVRGSAGTAFRAPALNDLFWPDSPFTGGNPDLRPEHGNTVEGSVERALAVPFGPLGDLELTGRAGAYQRRVRNQIDWAPDGTGKWQPRNVGFVRTRGVEAELELRYGPMKAAANVVSIDAVQRRAEIQEYDPFTFAPKTTAIVERTAAHTPSYTFGGRLGADLPTGTTVNLTLRGAGPRNLYIEDTTVTWPRTDVVTRRLPAHAVVNVRASQAVTSHLDLYAGIDNVTDERYAARFGNSKDDRHYPADPLTTYAGVRARW